MYKTGQNVHVLQSVVIDSASYILKINLLVINNVAVSLYGINKKSHIHAHILYLK